MSGNNEGDAEHSGPVGTNDDSLQDLINEAESLMNNLDKETSPVIGGFSIDSDEEAEDDGDQPLAPSPSKVAAVEDHPLSVENLSAPPTPAPTPPMNAAPASAADNNGSQTINVGSHKFNGGTGNGDPENGQMPAGMDGFKFQTSRFASGIASMAQRAATQMAAATAPVQVAGGPASQHGGNSSSGYSPTYPAQLPNRTPPTARNTSNGPSSGPVQQLDKEQKQQLVRDHVGPLLPGERVIMFLSNLLHVSDTAGLNYLASQSTGSYMWCCVMSYYRLILFSTAPTDKMELPKPADWNDACWPSNLAAAKLLELPLASLDRVEKTVYQAGGSSFMGIVVYSKDCCRVVRFTTPSYADTGRAYDSLNTYAFPGRRNLGYLFAFESKRQEVMASVQVDSNTGQQNITLPPTPKRFDPMMEYPRLLNRTSITNAPWIMWASINGTYQLTPSYPSVLVGPATLDETKAESQNIIRQCASFRSEQRLPVMSWCGVGGSSIWRASQPKVGLQGNRSPADELFLRHVAESARGANAMADPAPIYPPSILQQLTGDYSKDWVPESGCGLKILDLRPRASAMANRTGGYGYENTSYYTNITLQFCNIGNIHAIRDSYQKLCLVCNSESTNDVNFHSLLEDTKWLSHARTILAASWETAYWVHVWRMPILIHCSHGWDRTSQVSALAQILLDPYYRTRHGFSVLVEKDFMSFGHPFHLRSAHGEGRSMNTPQQSSTNDEGQISPIFLQFLDCVYQIVQLYPDCFEFNTQYLLELSFHIYSCRFGTMLCDSEREREVLAGIRLRTYSVWDYLDSKPECRNDRFNEAGGVLLMPLPTLLRNVQLWAERHCCFSRKPTLRPSLMEMPGLAKRQSTSPSQLAVDGGTSE